jgi:hypothetical protein
MPKRCPAWAKRIPTLYDGDPTRRELSSLKALPIVTEHQGGSKPERLSVRDNPVVAGSTTLPYGWNMQPGVALALCACQKLRSPLSLSLGTNALTSAK